MTTPWQQRDVVNASWFGVLAGGKDDCDKYYNDTQDC